MYDELVAQYKSERKRLGISQTEASLKGGVSMFTVSRMESGESRPRLDIFVKMCEGIGFMVAIVPLPSRMIEKVVIEAIEEPEVEESKEVDYDNWDYISKED